MRTTRAVSVVGGALLVAASAVVPVALTAAPAAETSGLCASDRGWELSTDRIDSDYTRHAFVGNGYLSQRVPPTGSGYAATGEKTGFPLETPRFDGAFVAGLYGEGPSSQSKQPRHAIAAIPTWSTLNVRVGDQTFGPNTPPEQISGFRQAVNLQCGVVRTSLTWTTPDGHATDLTYEVVADRAHPNVGAVRMRMTPRWDGPAEVSGAIDGAGARRLHPTGGKAEGGTVRVGFETDGVRATGTVASTLRADSAVDAEPVQQRVDGLNAEQRLGFAAQRGETYEFSKFVGVDTSVTTPDHAASAVRASREAADRGWDELFGEHAERWKRLWESDIRVPGRPDLQNSLRSSKYAILSSIRQDHGFSVPPAGLSSDNYAGLIFWDTELWMYPSLLLQHPDIARSVVDYREKMLGAARANAASIGQKGAFYPWTSADSGELAKDCHSWDPPHCLTQNHLQSDVALAAWQYFLATGDQRWLREHGWPVLRGVAEYWAGRVTANPDGSYSINNVAGPDEYSNGVNDGVFTNAGAAVTLRNATEAAKLLGEQAPPEWTGIADRLRIPYDPQQQVFQQYDGYGGQKIKQADAVLLQYPLEWPMPPEAAARTLDYYAPRTDPDGPAMTDSAHAIDAAATGEPGCTTNTYLNRSIRPFEKDPFAQFSEARGERAGEGAGAPTFNFLTGAGGYTQVFTHGLTGLRWRGDRAVLDPMLPPQLPGGVELTGLHWQGRTFDVRVGEHETQVRLREGEPFTVEAPDGRHVVSRDAALTLKTRRPDLVPTDNLARCKTASATSEEAGKYAEAAVDGNTATTWALNGAQGSATVDLGAPRRISGITPRWPETAPTGFRLLTSVDGREFTEAAEQIPGGRLARYVRVELTGPAGPEHTGLSELEVRG
ncbi:trehalose/maltose hydrolase-like predicted phosphorylase [Saccharopolyspora erythraea NRRL 2338]|uniref:HAD-superfamily hydrolase subfamily IA, variant 3 n=2 Tax=Saccharopolyspora erythraea TaxID=1836 RepID=A4FEH4_SACEN|nr:glycosyl hydrolase family 65 protein [Saccharopolyspora erythraea]PFG96175.1 trehalose/maltose hydrolase-like predicted phosphorylase [Saccharopolyspora erythraea NRRL 2338]QRK92708.1 discoidin domain-containing protein [Saccharopolyspora erythraea]CAM02449.1 HAD-superfamily hydrolase subfamily IA, variant 3 [Saccharopolyspora erythraea NRRL 2338]